MSETQRKGDAPFLEQTLRARLQNFLTRRIQNPWALDRRHLQHVRHCPSTSASMCSDPEPRSLSEKLLCQNIVLWSGFSPGEVYRKVLGHWVFQIDVPGVLCGRQDCFSCSLIPALQVEAPPRLSSWSLGQDCSVGNPCVPLPHRKPVLPVTSKQAGQMAFNSLRLRKGRLNVCFYGKIYS